MSARQRLVMALRPRGKLAFLRSLVPAAKVLDVGCGNNSPRESKRLRPDIFYAGIDVGDFNQTASIEHADRYVITPPARFAATIGEFGGQMDGVVSNHNIEHCDDPAAVMRAMLASLAPGGRIFLAFPCEESVNFPKRRGTLNFFDDHTHKVVPRWADIMGSVQAEGLVIEYACRRYRPLLLALVGLVLEPLSALTRRNMPAGVGWALYGFESIIWARRERQVKMHEPLPPDSRQ